LSMTALAFFVAVIVFGYFGKKADDKKRRIDYINEIGAKEENQSPQASFYDRYLKKYVKKLTVSFSSQGARSKVQKSREKDQLVERQLRLSGVFMSAQEFGSIKLTFTFVCLTVTALLALILPFNLLIKGMLFLVGSVVAIIGPSFFLKSKVKGHQQKIREQLPDAMDLLGVCIEAGLSFDIALVKVAERLKGPFVDELLIVHREIQMGRTRRDALQNLIACTDIPELKTFVSALAQAEQLGIPIINVMRIQSAQLRVTRKQLAQEKGMKAPIKILIPMIIFIFPVIFIILLGPTVINVMEEFANK
jgi:tight adherence protein C